MCEPVAEQPLARYFASPVKDAEKATSSARRHLWELPANTHCPVIGLCLPLGVLRRLVNKGLRGKALADDYELHVGAVAECSARNRVSELLEKALDQRHCVALHRFKGAKDADAVAMLWLDAKRAGDMAGAFWAALTHPRSDFRVQDMVLREMHMIQHQAGAGRRVEIVRFNALRGEHTALVQAQERHARTLADKVREVGQLGAQLMRARADIIVRDSAMAFLQADMEQLAASIPDLEARTRLQHKLDQAAQREHGRDIQVKELRRELAAALQQVAAVSTALPETQPEPVEAVAGVRLDDKTVLCVGGRSGNIPTYRGMTEQTGAQFVHHDGGREDSPALLDASLAAADLVICQTGCISHNAYWRVKNYCKRTGKQCVFVENPSSSSFSGWLKRIALVADA